MFIINKKQGHFLIIHYFIKIVDGFHWLFLSMAVAINFFTLTFGDGSDNY